MKFFIANLFILLSAALIFAEKSFSANEQFRTITSGNWNSTSTWEMSLNGSTWFAATSTPSDTSGVITVRSPNTVSVTASVSADQLTVDNGATLSVNSGITLTILAGAGNDLTVNSGGTVSGSGTIQTQGNVLLNLRGGSNFISALKINTGTATVTDLGTPYDADLFGNVTIDAAGTLNTNNTASYDLSVYGSITNNGIITGTGNSQLSHYGPALINNGSITTSVFNFDSTTAISGSGTYTGSKIYVGPTGNVSLSNDVTFSPSSELLFYGGGIFSANTNILTVSSGLFSVNSGATVVKSGLIRMQGGAGLNPRGGSNFNADLNIASGTTEVSDLGSPYKAKLFGNVSVNSGATLFTDNTASYTLSIYGNLTNNGTISGVGSTLRFFGAALINDGSITSPNFYFDSTSTISGTGTYTGAKIYVGPTGNVSLLNNVTIAPTGEFLINNGGIFSANTKTLRVNSGLFTINSGGTVVKSGLIRMAGGAGLNPRGGSNFNANLNIFSGTTEISDLGSPYKARLNGNVTVNSGATLFTDNTASYTLSIFGNLTNDGTISGVGSTLRFFGAALTNSGSIVSPHFYFDSVSTISGTGSFTGNNIYVGGNGNVSLLNDVTFSPVTEFLVLTGGNFSANTHTLIFNAGIFTVNTGATVVNSGLIRTENGADINPRSGSTFNADIKIASGSTQISDLGTPYNARLYGNITVDAGATLYTDNTESYTLFIFGNILNNGTIAGTGDLEIQSGAHTIQGTGIWTTDLFILSGGNVTLLSDHQFFAADIRAGGTFNISNRTARFSASNPITQNGTFIVTNSNVEYNGLTLQTISTANIAYDGLIINDTLGTILSNNVSVN